MHRFRLLLAFTLLLTPALALAQDKPASPAPLPEWDQLSSTQREELIAPLRDRWNSSPDERARLYERARHWKTMPPECAPAGPPRHATLGQDVARATPACTGAVPCHAQDGRCRTQGVPGQLARHDATATQGLGRIAPCPGAQARTRPGLTDASPGPSTWIRRLARAQARLFSRAAHRPNRMPAPRLSATG